MGRQHALVYTSRIYLCNSKKYKYISLFSHLYCFTFVLKSFVLKNF